MSVIKDKIEKLICDRTNHVDGNLLTCIKPIMNIRYGSGCEVGKKYWFEYVHNDIKPFYRKLSDNNHSDEVYITDEELNNNFIFDSKIATYKDLDRIFNWMNNVSDYKEYLEKYHIEYPEKIPLTFREMFDYDYIVHENGNVDFIDKQNIKCIK